MSGLTGFLLAACLASHGVDAGTTLYATPRGFREANPVFRTSTEIVAAKLVWGSTMTAVTLKANRQHPRLVRWALVAATVPAVWATQHNLRQIHLGDSVHAHTIRR